MKNYINRNLKGTKLKYKLDSGDNIEIQNILSSRKFSLIIPYVSDYDLIIIDEALKIINDTIYNMVIIVIGLSLN